MSANFSRRKFIGTGAGVAAGAGALVMAGGTNAFGAGSAASLDPGSQGTEPFFGTHQAGIETGQQDRLVFAIFDVTATSKDQIKAMLQAWTAGIANMTQGKDLGADDGNLERPPVDTGMAFDLDPAHLTVTVGFGISLFTKGGKDRFGLNAQRPAALADLPHFKAEDLNPNMSDGDIVVQACSNDETVAFSAVRNLIRLGRGTVTLKYLQQGFNKLSATTPGNVTPRNILEFKDGTNNIDRNNRPDFDQQVYVQSGDGPAWMTNGSYVVMRRIRNRCEVWDRTALGEQQNDIGRFKRSGAPLTGVNEHDDPDFNATNPDGSFKIPRTAHIFLASQKRLNTFFKRRGYHFADGFDRQTGHLDAGLFFLAYQRDPRKQFNVLQGALNQDALNEYLTHVSSGVYACPPGVSQGQYLGQTLFG